MPERGTLMGNRGILHDEQRSIVRDWQVRRWIACRLTFRGRHRVVLQPGHYTELFFLDEAAALADGHRPCAECRHADFRAFRTAWRTVHPARSAAADDIDAVLHAERRTSRFAKRTYAADLATLPDGTYVALQNSAWLVLGDVLLAWSAGGYTQRMRRESESPGDIRVEVLTPRSIVDVLRVGYQPLLHPSANARNA